MTGGTLSIVLQHVIPPKSCSSSKVRGLTTCQAFNPAVKGGSITMSLFLTSHCIILAAYMCSNKCEGRPAAAMHCWWATEACHAVATCQLRPNQVCSEPQPHIVSKVNIPASAQARCAHALSSVSCKKQSMVCCAKGHCLTTMIVQEIQRTTSTR